MATHTTSDTSRTKEFLLLRFDAFELDEADARLTRDGKPIPLAPRPFAVLCALARTPRTLVTKDALLDSVWGHRFVTDSVLKTAVSALRAALDDDPKQPRYIETVSRRGYRFIATATAPDVPAAVAAPTPGTTVSTLVRTESAPITGRAEALERLRAAWQRARAGKRHIVWVVGEPGVGKTTLIEHFIAEIGEASSAHGQCVEQAGAGEPYLPALEALSDLCRRDASFTALVRAVAPTWLLQLPWLCTADEREALRRELAGSGQTRMLREFGELLERYTENQPLLLVSEDLHWSDHATLQLMDHIARRRGSARLLWLASFRLTEIMATDHPLKPLRHELRLHGLAEEIVLDAFSETDVADYLAARIPGLAAEETFVRALHARTEGLPLFVADVVSDLMEGGDVTADGELSALGRLGSMAIPENLAGIVEQYIQRLTPGERALLEAASVCGFEFRPATVAKVLETDVARTDQLCADLARRQRWLTDEPLKERASADAAYVFRHALYREVLYHRIAPLARVGLHRKVATAFERDRADGCDVSAVELASHFERAEQPMPALRYYAEAVELALLHFSPAQAMSLADHAMALLPLIEASSARTTLEVTLATLKGAAAIQLLGNASIEVKRAFDRAQLLLDDVPEHPLRGLFLPALGLCLYMRGEVDEASALAQRSEALSIATEDRMVLLCACVIRGLVEHMRGRPQVARQWLEQGVQAVDGLDETASPAVFSADPSVIILGLLGVELLHVGLVDQGRARIRDASARARALREPAPQLAALWFDALFETRMSNPGRVAEIAEEMRALVEEYALPQGHAAHLWFRGWAEAHVGDPRTGYRLIRQGYEEAARLGIRAWASETLGSAAEALAIAGDWVAARQQLDEAMECSNAIGEREYVTQLLLLDARIADALGEPDRAREAMRQAIAEARAQEGLWLQLISLSALCEREDATAEDFESLRFVVDQLTEGLDSVSVATARALLEKAHAA